MPMNLPNHLCMIIHFKLKAIKIVVKVEHFAAICFFLNFSELLNKCQGQFREISIQI